MKKVLTIAASCLVLAGCINTNLGPATAQAPAEQGVNAERTTGSNLSGRARERDRTVQQGNREDVERMQRPGGSADLSGRAR